MASGWRAATTFSVSLCKEKAANGLKRTEGGQNMYLFDCTLRDGANVIGKGFDARLTRMMIEGLIRSNIKVIEMGNCL